MHTNRLVAIGLALTLGLGACAGNDSKESKDEPKTSTAMATPKVTVKDFVFAPSSITVKKGTTVSWTNNDDFDHSIQIDSIDLDGPKFGPQTMPASYMHQFTEEGTYAYLCGVHNSMTGTVIVTN